MHYRSLGRIGWQVSGIGHGLWGMSGWTGSDDTSSRQSLQASADLGCNFYDTAWAYGEGKSDFLLGELIAHNRGRRLYAASKIPPKNRKWPASSEYKLQDVFPADHVFEYADRIRDNMKVETIDLLQFHVWSDSWADDPEWTETVQTLKSKKIISAFGLSLNRWEPENGIKAIRTGHVDTVQVVYNVLDQNPEKELFKVCQELNVGVIARVPLDEGSLSGKFTMETRFPENDWRSNYFKSENLKNTIDRIEKLKALVPDGMTLPEMAFRFILSHPVVSTTIPGMRNIEHVKSNLAVNDGLKLSESLMAELRKLNWDRRSSPWVG
jgi:aryl-alcohol dehydrogenase-like predicted oxidoreductase